MKIVVGSILVLMYLLSVLFLPVSIKQVFKSIENISVSTEYVMKRIKVDSIVAHDTETSTYYSVYSTGLDRTLVVTDHDKNVLIGKENDEQNISHMYDYMRTHQDSIWIWYHTEAELKYARVESPAFSNKEDRLYLFISLSDVVVAIVGTILVMQYSKKKKTA
jgi:hypothetical protein